MALQDRDQISREILANWFENCGELIASWGKCLACEGPQITFLEVEVKEAKLALGIYLSRRFEQAFSFSISSTHHPIPKFL
jgi:hypothetical protein